MSLPDRVNLTAIAGALAWLVKATVAAFIASGMLSIGLAARISGIIAPMGVWDGPGSCYRHSITRYRCGPMNRRIGRHPG